MFDKVSEPLILRTQSLAELLDVSQLTIRRWEKDGKLPKSYKIGGIKIWRREEIVSWVNAGSPSAEDWISMGMGMGR